MLFAGVLGALYMKWPQENLHGKFPYLFWQIFVLGDSMVLIPVQQKFH